MHEDTTRRDGDGKQDQREQAESPPLLEWVMGAIGLVLLLASLGYLGWQALRGAAVPPTPVIETVGVEQRAGRFLLRFRVHNQGTETAERLQVSGRLRQLGLVVEESSTEFDFLPGGSSREGGLFFLRNPERHELALEARSYQKP